MTEVPDFLLKRSQDRRAALSGAAPTAEPSASKEVAKTVTSSAAPALAAEVAPPPPPKPDPAYVVAAKSRKKIPFWAMATLSLLPVWAFLYLLAVSPVVREESGPMATGAEVYGACASCHGANGQGGAGRWRTVWRVGGHAGAGEGGLRPADLGPGRPPPHHHRRGAPRRLMPGSGMARRLLADRA